jgi:hypothetical protein
MLERIRLLPSINAGFFQLGLDGMPKMILASGNCVIHVM